jgi:hypothetical protein
VERSEPEEEKTMIMHAGKTRHAGWPGVARVAGWLGLALVIFLGGYLLIYRPQELRWGATGEEVARAMPGDQIQPQPIFNATRAVTIQARSEQIWPWLVQIGYQRAGWYGYDWIDNDGLKSADRIIPQLQHVQVGDTIQMLKGVNFKVVAVEPNHYLVWASPDGATAWWWLSTRSTGVTRAWSGGFMLITTGHRPPCSFPNSSAT